MNTKTLSLFAATVSSLSLTGCFMSPSVWVEESEDFELSTDNVAAVACKTHNGTVRVTGADTKKISVSVKKRGGGSDETDAESALDAIEITKERHGASWRIGWRWRQTRKTSWGSQVSFTIKHPPGLASTSETHNGSIVVSGAQRGVRANTHNGRIEIRKCAGDLRATTHNGGITAEAKSNKVHFETHNGAIKAVLSAPGPISGRLETHNGGVTLGLAQDASTDVNVSTHNGSIRVAEGFATTHRGKRSYRGRLGQGGGRLEIETHNGTVTLSR